ncbi:MAG: DUF5663 domain-containing protein [Planctomycetes bacterium]|jgi:hypothetical protein|nr:DUF5663 domain-containing protein [Planctomycetota bacterium]
MIQVTTKTIEENYVVEALNQLVVLAGLESLPEEEKNVFKANMAGQIARRIGLIILKNLSNEGLDAYEKLLKENPLPDPEVMEDFLKKYLPNSQEVIQEGLTQFFEEIKKSFN